MRNGIITFDFRAPDELVGNCLTEDKFISQKAKSNATQVTLVDLDSDATGIYSCEVSADAPSFHTVIVSGTMDVVGKNLFRFFE